MFYIVPYAECYAKGFIVRSSNYSFHWGSIKYSVVRICEYQFNYEDQSVDTALLEL